MLDVDGFVIDTYLKLVLLAWKSNEPRDFPKEALSKFVGQIAKTKQRRKPKPYSSREELKKGSKLVKNKVIKSFKTTYFSIESLLAVCSL